MEICCCFRSRWCWVLVLSHFYACFCHHMHKEFLSCLHYYNVIYTHFGTHCRRVKISKPFTYLWDKNHQRKMYLRMQTHIHTHTYTHILPHTNKYWLRPLFHSSSFTFYLTAYVSNESINQWYALGCFNQLTWKCDVKICLHQHDLTKGTKQIRSILRNLTVFMQCQRQVKILIISRKRLVHFVWWLKYLIDALQNYNTPFEKSD